MVKNIMDYTEFPEYDILYCDPPWGQGMVKFFNTQMFKDTGIRIETTFEGIINKLSELSSELKPIYIEMDAKNEALLIQYMTPKHRYICSIDATQSNGNPYKIILFNNAKPFESGLVGFNQIKIIAEHYKGQRVFDPFSGIGKTKKAFERSGCTYIGSELNPKRYSRQ